MVHIECPTLSLRKRFECSDEDFDIFINMSELGGTLEVCTFIVTSEDLKGYTNPHFHPDYSSIPGFDLKKGQVLAIGTSKIFDVEKTGDSLTSLPSIIQVVKSGDKQKDALTVNTSSDDHITKIRLLGVYVAPICTTMPSWKLFTLIMRLVSQRHAQKL